MQVQARRPAPPAGVAALALFAFVAAARPAAAETQEKLLPNGLKIIVHEMHGAPLVTVMTLYRVGSVHEPAGRTGITHLCEHMLFKGSRRYPDGEVDRAVMRCGGYINGFTNTGQITFFQVVPRELLGEFLDRHADAMEQATFDPAEFKREMVVVRSELEGYENDPAYLLEAALFATAFQVHGLRWPIIGWRADVERTTAEDAREWYRAYFRPNNAVLIVTGDVDGPATLGEIERRFGGLARGRTPPEPSPEPPQQGERRVTLRLPASAPLLEIGYKNPPMGHADAFALEVLQFILGEGRGARLRRSLIDAGLAADAEANNYWDHCPTLFIVRATGLPGKDPAPIEAAIDADIARVQAEGVTAEEVAQAVRQTARRRAFALDSTEKTASSLGDFEGYSSYRYAFRLTEEVGKVTPERVQEVARKYLTKENRTVAWVLPTERPAGLDLRGAGAEIDRSPGAPGAANSPAGGAAATGTGVGGERPAEAPGQPEEFRLPNGLRVLVWANPAAPTMALRVRWPGGAAASGDHPGASAVALEMLHEGTLAHDRAAFRRELESRGLEIGTRLDVETAELSLACLPGDFAAAAGLVAEFLTRPAWPEAAFPVVRERVRGGLAQEADDPDRLGVRALCGALFPPGHPYYRPPLDATLASVGALDLATVRTLHERVCRPDAAVLAIAGRVPLVEARRIAESAFGAWDRGVAPPPPAFPAPRPLPPGDHRILVPMPGKSETFGAIALPVKLARAAPEYPAFDVMNCILGGGQIWETRLGKSIRVQHGLAYDVRSFLTPTLDTGYFCAQFGANPENAEQALGLLTQEIRRLRDGGVTADEVRDTVAYRLGSLVRQTETAEQRTTLVCDLATYGLGLDYATRRVEQYRAVTPEQVQKAARDLLDPDRWVEVLAGPREGR